MNLSVIIERIWLMATIEFRLKYVENKLGLLWAIIKPLQQLLLYYIIFDVVLQSRQDNYGVFIFSGLICWLFFVDMSTGTISMLRTKKYLYEYTNMHKLEIYASVWLNNLFGLIISFIILVIFCLFQGIYPTWSWLLYPLVMFNALLLGMGVSLILSNLFLLFKDISQIWNIATGFLFFLSPILFDLGSMAPQWKWLEMINPISPIVINSRGIILHGSGMNFEILLFGIGYSLFLIGIGYVLFKKYAKRAAELI